MGQDSAANEGASSSFTDSEVARTVLDLDREITRQRRANALHCLVEGDAYLLPVKPTRIELSVFRALAQTYGPTLLQQAFFTPVLERIATCGAVVLVQQALWGERPDDLDLAARLLDARVPFDTLCATRPEAFMAQAHAELKGFRPQPPGSFPLDEHSADD